MDALMKLHARQKKPAKSGTEWVSMRLAELMKAKEDGKIVMRGQTKMLVQDDGTLKPVRLKFGD